MELNVKMAAKGVWSESKRREKKGQAGKINKCNSATRWSCSSIASFLFHLCTNHVADGPAIHPCCRAKSHIFWMACRSAGSISGCRVCIHVVWVRIVG